jgi:hypothetical protein
MRCRNIVCGLALLTGLAGCRRLVVRSEVHLIPEGYVGPVVIVFGDPTGAILKRDTDGTFLFDIPATGYLRFKSDPPKPSWSETHYYYVKRDGKRLEIPRGRDPQTLQIFGEVSAGSGTVNGQPMIPTGTYEYIVGIPAARSDWLQLREALSKGVAPLRAAGSEITPAP